MSALSRHRHVCSVTTPSCLLCHDTVMSALSRHRHWKWRHLYHKVHERNLFYGAQNKKDIGQYPRVGQYVQLAQVEHVQYKRPPHVEQTQYKRPPHMQQAQYKRPPHMQQTQYQRLPNLGDENRNVNSSFASTTGHFGASLSHAEAGPDDWRYKRLTTTGPACGPQPTGRERRLDGASGDRSASRRRLHDLSARAGVSPSLYSHSARLGGVKSGQRRRLDTTRYHWETVPLLIRGFGKTPQPLLPDCRLRNVTSMVTRSHKAPSPLTRYLPHNSPHLLHGDRPSATRPRNVNPRHSSWTR
ncbi:hypothetical protein LSAT2_009436 [Lamellibrachia satsuma]|nr:hypothetical protein LSAT2_009436 [Lamellibrachia satsuma]